MSTRGPKPKTAVNASRKPPRALPLTKLNPPSELNAEALAEFRRLIAILDNRGTLERVDLAVVAECARIKDLLDRAHGFVDRSIDPKMIAVVTQLTSQRRGLLREMGLSIMPSRSVVKTTMKSPEATTEPVAKLIKMAE
jgi:phage terminase small subunit